jgi:hypothetical protein
LKQIVPDPYLLGLHIRIHLSIHRLLHVLCADKKEEQIELLELEKSGIHVAQYLTVLPPKEILETKLHQAIESAKAKYFIDNKEKISHDGQIDYKI